MIEPVVGEDAPTALVFTKQPARRKDKSAALRLLICAAALRRVFGAPSADRPTNEAP
jgi:hypothetical protein